MMERVQSKDHPTPHSEGDQRVANGYMPTAELDCNQGNRPELGKSLRKRRHGVSYHNHPHKEIQHNIKQNGTQVRKTSRSSSNTEVTIDQIDLSITSNLESSRGKDATDGERKVSSVSLQSIVSFHLSTDSDNEESQSATQPEKKEYGGQMLVKIELSNGAQGCSNDKSTEQTPKRKKSAVSFQILETNLSQSDETPESVTNTPKEQNETETSSCSNIETSIRQILRRRKSQEHDRRESSVTNPSHASVDSLWSVGTVSEVETELEETEFSEKHRGSRWSVHYLRKIFLDVAIEKIYARYWLKLQRFLLFKLILVIIFYVLVILILYNTIAYDHKPQENQNSTNNVTELNADDSSLWTNVFFVSTLLVDITMAVLVYLPKVYYRLWRILAIFFYVFLNSMLYASIPITSRCNSIACMDNVPMVFYLIFVIHTMLPTSRNVSLLLGCIAGLTDIVIVAVLSDDPLDTKMKQLTANSLIYICSNITGYYHKHFTDLAHRHTFLDTRMVIESDIKCAKERHRQNMMKENLLLKIIPKYLLDDMKMVLNENRGNNRELGHVFRELLVDRHNNVSILYADIVQFTSLTEELPASDLVKVLNALFGRFDDLSEANNCLRIKILGDCYYCVSGLPTPIRDHARNCVIMGIQMLQVIRKIRRKTGVEKLDMRIGIHTGYALCGVLGLKKWQYDVWSDDVTIANHMEAAGVAGRIHISGSTLEALKTLGGGFTEFEVEPANDVTYDKCLQENNIETYLIAESEFSKIELDDKKLRRKKRISRSASQRFQRSSSVVEYMDTWGMETPFQRLSDYMPATVPTAESEETSQLNKRLERTFRLEESEDTEEVGEQMPSTWKEFNRLTLFFKDWDLEKLYANQRDASYKFYVACAFAIFLFMIVVQFIILIRTWSLMFCFILGLVVYTVLLILVTGLKCLPCFDKFPESTQRRLLLISDRLITNRWAKVGLSLISAIITFLTSMLPVEACNVVNHPDPSPYRKWPAEDVKQLTINNTTTDDTSCLFAPYYLYTCMLALISCSVFLRISYMVKMCFMLAGLILFNIMFYHVFYYVFSAYDALINTDFLSSRVRGTFYTTVVFVTLVVLDRQIEKNLRWDFLCQTKIRQDEHEVHMNEMLNNRLLANILPIHVAEHFTRPDRPAHEFYHKHYRNVSVMFAAIPDFKAFFSSIDVTGKECLRLLNEMISAFDMLIDGEFKSVEKIKTIGSTYMAATGLLANDDTQEDPERAETNVILLTRFAFAMMDKLDELSKHVFYHYKLKIGINHGEVIAGVVGAQKPQYDIWGDAVNVASRMESHGLLGQIQIPASTAIILNNNGIPCNFRGTVNVKGKGPMRLYLVSRRKSVRNVTSPLGFEQDAMDTYWL